MSDAVPEPFLFRCHSWSLRPPGVDFAASDRSPFQNDFRVQIYDWSAGASPASTFRASSRGLYSVLQYVADLKGACVFIAAIAGLLALGGRALIGDLPNTNVKARNAKAADAASQSTAWQRQIDDWRRNNGDAHPFDDFAGNTDIGGFTDKDIMDFIADLRTNGFDAYWLPQPLELPFGKTREDLLIIRG